MTDMMRLSGDPAPAGALDASQVERLFGGKPCS